MAMRETGMGNMMEMGRPKNTLPMMTGDGPFGPVEMGGMLDGQAARCDRSILMSSSTKTSALGITGGAITETHYRRPLPADAIAFSSPEGRQIFAEALAAGGLEGYFTLAEQFHTQSEPAYCGLGSLVMALNALAIDPGRTWKGPWRWFGEELLDCCSPLEDIREHGLALDELACLARCNGVDVAITHADAANLEAWRASLETAAHGGRVLVASYDRAALDQTGSGHFSPIGGYHAARDLVLVLDVARFKYPPHWLPAERLWRAMQPVDPTTGRTRGWLLLEPRATVEPSPRVKCEGFPRSAGCRRGNGNSTPAT